MEALRETHVLHFRQDVARRLNVECERVRLIFAGQVLNDSAMIEKYEIFDGSVVHVVVRSVTSVPSTASASNGSAILSRRTNSEVTNSPPYFGIYPGVLESSGEDVGMGRMMMNSLSLSIGDMDEDGRGANGYGCGSGSGESASSSSTGSNIGMDAMFSNMFMGSLAGSIIAGSGTQHSRTVLKAKEQFGNTVESGLSSIRCIKYNGDNSNNNMSGSIIYEDIDPRSDEPSLAIAQMLSELGTSLNGLTTPILRMSEEMQTGAFLQCTTSSQRISRQSELSNMKATLLNIANAVQYTAKSLALLSLEVVPGTQPPLRTSVPFAAAAAAATAAATAAVRTRIIEGKDRDGLIPPDSKVSSSIPVANTATAAATSSKSKTILETKSAGIISTSHTAASTAAPSKPRQSTALAKGFLNRPSKNIGTSSTLTSNSNSDFPAVVKTSDAKASSVPIVPMKKSTCLHTFISVANDSDSCSESQSDSSDDDDDSPYRRRMIMEQSTLASIAAAASARGDDVRRCMEVQINAWAAERGLQASKDREKKKAEEKKKKDKEMKVVTKPTATINTSKEVSNAIGSIIMSCTDGDSTDRKVPNSLSGTQTGTGTDTATGTGTGTGTDNATGTGTGKGIGTGTGTGTGTGILTNTTSNSKSTPTGDVAEVSQMICSTSVTVPGPDSIASPLLNIPSDSEISVPQALIVNMCSATHTRIPAEELGPVAFLSSMNSIINIEKEGGTIESGTTIAPAEVTAAATITSRTLGSDTETRTEAAEATAMTISSTQGSGVITASIIDNSSNFSSSSTHTNAAKTTPFKWSPRGGKLISLGIEGGTGIGPLVKRKYNAAKSMPTVSIRQQRSLVSSIQPFLSSSSSSSSSLSSSSSSSLSPSTTSSESLSSSPSSSSSFSQPSTISSESTFLEIFHKDNVPKDNVPKENVPNDTIPEDNVPMDYFPVDEVSKDNVPKNIVP